MKNINFGLCVVLFLLFYVLCDSNNYCSMLVFVVNYHNFRCLRSLILKHYGIGDRLRLLVEIL